MHQKQTLISNVKQESCTYKAEEKTLYGSLYAPDCPDNQKLAGLILFPSFRGKDAFAEEKARLLAQEGYIVLAADPYGEKEPASDDTEAMRRMMPLFLNRPLLQQRAKAAFDALCQIPHVDTARIGALGFCFGGLTALELLRLGISLKGIVSLHGAFSDRKGEAQAKIGVRSRNLAGRSALFLHGNDDPLVSEQDLMHLRKELTEAKVDWTLTIYGHTSHAFTNPAASSPKDGLVYNPSVAKRAWQATCDFFCDVLTTK